MTRTRPILRIGPGALALVTLLGGIVRGAPAPARSAPAARVDVEVVPGPEGFLGQWLVTDPVQLPGYGKRPARLHGSVFPGVAGVWPGRAGPRPRRRALHWRVVTGADPVIDLRHCLKLWPAQQYRAALMGIVLEARRAFTAWLAVGHDDGVELWLNGRRLLSDRSSRPYEPDARLVRLALSKGRNRLVLLLAHGRGHWRVRLRLTGPDHVRLGSGSSRGLVRLLLPVPAAEASRARQRWVARGLVTRLRRRITRTGVSYTAALAAPAGVVLTDTGRVPTRLRVQWGAREQRTAIGVDLRRLAARPFPRPQRLVWPANTRKAVAWLRWDVPGRKPSTLPLWRAATLCRRLLSAEARLGNLAAGGSRDTVAYHLQAVRRRVEQGDRDRRYLTRRLWWARRWLDTLARGRDPFQRAHGRLVLAHRAVPDGTLQPYSLYVPRGYRGRHSWPLYVWLHGMHSTHRKGLSLMLGTWPAKGDPTPFGKWLRRPRRIQVHPPAFVLAPQAYGDAFYHHAGEVDVLEALADVTRRYRIDPARIILVGHSMGGTGVLDLGVRYPDRFAGAVSLAGYPTRWIHEEIRKGPFRAGERLLARLYSPIYWAENGRHLPIIAVHGRKDGPWKSRFLVARWKRLRQPAELKLFEGGHDVWRHYLDRGQVYRDTRTWRRPAAPRRITFRTPRLRWNRAWWVRIDDRPRSDAWSAVDAHSYHGNRIRLKTTNVSALTLRPTWPRYVARAATRLTVDGATLSIPPGAGLSIHRAGGRWQRGPAPNPRGLRKRPGLEGPVDDLYHGPILVVVGTRDPRQTPALRRVGEALRRYEDSSARYPIKTDRQVTDADRRRYHLILVGAAHANLETARYAARLPIRVTRRAVRVGRCVFRGDDKAALFIHPNPDVPGRYLLVLAGTSASAVLRVHRLPWYLPDFLVYDRSIEAGHNLRILGPDRRFLAAGFFTRRWRLPSVRCARSGSVRPNGSRP